MYESLNPLLKDIRDVYEKEFRYMEDEDVSCKELVFVRDRLIKLIKNELTTNEREFLVSFKNAEPDWNLLGIDGVDRLLAVRWKLYNIQKMSKEKRDEFAKKLELALK